MWGLELLQLFCHNEGESLSNDWPCGNQSRKEKRNQALTDMIKVPKLNLPLYLPFVGIESLRSISFTLPVLCSYDSHVLVSCLRDPVSRQRILSLKDFCLATELGIWNLLIDILHVLKKHEFYFMYWCKLFKALNSWLIRKQKGMNLNFNKRNLG